MSSLSWSDTLQRAQQLASTLEQGNKTATQQQQAASYAHLQSLQKALEQQLSQAEQNLSVDEKELARREAQLLELGQRVEALEQRRAGTTGKDQVNKAGMARPVETGLLLDLGQDPLTALGGNVPLEPPPPEFPESPTEEGLVRQQQTMMTDQDDHLEQLSRVIARQKDLGLAISQELDDQADMLEEMERGIDQTQSRVQRARGRLDRISEAANDKRVIAVMALLILVIIILIAVKKR